MSAFSRSPPAGHSTGNPLSTTYKTSDGRFVMLTCLQAAKYWAEACEVFGRPELATDERFATAEALMDNAATATELLREAFAERTADEWRERLAGFSGQWAMLQDTLEAAADEQSVANGLIQECKTAHGTPFQLVAAPVQYDEDPSAPQRSPEFNEQGDAILEDLGLEMDKILDLKVRGVLA